MRKELYDKLKDIGFNPFSAVNIEFPSKTFLSTTPAGSNYNTNILVYYNTVNDFAVMLPAMKADVWQITYYGNTDEIKEKVIELEQQIERGEI